MAGCRSRQALVQACERLGLGALGATGKHRHRPPVVGTGGQRATDGELDLRKAELLAEQHDVDHLARRLRGRGPVLDREPHLVEARRPLAPLAPLGERHRARQGTRLAGEDARVVAEAGSDLVAAGQALVGGDDRAAGEDLDPAGADPRSHPAAEQLAGDRVAVLAHRDHRLGVHPHRCLLAGVEGLARQRSQAGPLDGEGLADAERPTGDPPVEV